MTNVLHPWRRAVLFLTTILFVNHLQARCFQISDDFGSRSNNPYFVSCNGGDYTVFIQSNDTLINHKTDWGDERTDSLQNATYSYADSGKYKICFTDSTLFCVDTVFTKMTVERKTQVMSKAGFTEGCAPLEVSFQNVSVGATQYTWDFGDGNFSSRKNPSYIYYEPGVYTVKLIANGNGHTTLIKVDSVVVHEKAIARFGYKSQKVVIPDEEIQFFNQSVFATKFEWDFGDGNTSTEEYPKHKYEEVGEFFVSLKASNEYGCVDEYSAKKPLIIEALGEIEFPNAFIPNPEISTGGFYEKGSTTNDIFFPKIQGVENYELTIYNRWGEKIFQTTDPNQGWDGYYREQLCQQDSYVWKVKAVFSNGEIVNKVGTVTLLQ